MTDGNRKMKLRPTTKAKNKRTIIVNYAVAIIFFSIGMYTGRLIYYVGGGFGIILF